MNTKPSRPSSDFPLFPHASGQWAKKIKGKIHYFGVWANPDQALASYNAYVSANTVTPVEPPVVETGSTLAIEYLCFIFLEAKEEAREKGLIAEITFRDLRRTCQSMVNYFGRDRLVTTLTPADFLQYKTSLHDRLNVQSISNEVTRVKSVFNWLVKYKHIDAIDFGPDFKKSSARVLRKHKRESGKKLFTNKQILALLKESGVDMKAMILLGINCGFGNNDCNQISLRTAKEAIKTGWMNFPRPKTEVDRQCWLWPETISALKRVIRQRTESSLPNLFILGNGRAYSVENNDISKRFRTVRQYAFIRKGGFYWLRHTFETVGGDLGDQVAVDYIMGHVDDSMAASYREEVFSPRLRKISDHVHSWLFSKSLA